VTALVQASKGPFKRSKTAGWVLGRAMLNKPHAGYDAATSALKAAHFYRSSDLAGHCLKQ
jgi:hypothetical protein